MSDLLPLTTAMTFVFWAVVLYAVARQRVQARRNLLAAIHETTPQSPRSAQHRVTHRLATALVPVMAAAAITTTVVPAAAGAHSPTALPVSRQVEVTAKH